MAGSPRFVGYSTTALRCPDEENATDDILLTDTNPIQAITLDEIVSTFEAEGRSMEVVIRDSYRIQTVDDAVRELERMQSGLIQIILFLSR